MPSTRGWNAVTGETPSSVSPTTSSSTAGHRLLAEAEGLLEGIKLRLAECKLTVHPEKTKIVYCRDRNRRGDYERTEFDFLSFTFRPRTARGKGGKLFLAFTPAISRKSERAIKDEIRKWRVHRAVTADLEELSMLYNEKLRGWIAYFGKFRASALYGIFCMFQKILVMGEAQIQAPEKELAESLGAYEDRGRQQEAFVRSLGAWLVCQWGSVKSRMVGDYQVRFRERLGVKIPRPTRLNLTIWPVMVPAASQMAGTTLVSDCRSSKCSTDAFGAQKKI